MSKDQSKKDLNIESNELTDADLDKVAGGAVQPTDKLLTRFAIDPADKNVLIVPNANTLGKT